MALVAYDGSSSESETEDSSSRQKSQTIVCESPEASPVPAKKVKLPNFFTGSKIKKPSQSVFTSAFTKAERAKHKVLEKHVKLIDFDESKLKAKSAKTKQRACKQFIFGKCRYADKCKFSHDLSTQKANQQQPQHSKQTTIYTPAISKQPIDNPGRIDVTPNVNLPLGSSMPASDSSAQTAVSASSGSSSSFPSSAAAAEAALSKDFAGTSSKLNNPPARQPINPNQRLAPSKRSAAKLTQMRRAERPWTMGQCGGGGSAVSDRNLSHLKHFPSASTDLNVPTHSNMPSGTNISGSGMSDQSHTWWQQIR